MLPNWIYYFLGKKSGGDSPTPPEPPAGKPVVPNGLRMFASFNSNTLTSQDLQNFIDSLDFSNVTKWNNYFYSMITKSGFVIDLSNVSLVDSIIEITSIFQNSSNIKTIYLWKDFDTSSCVSFQSLFGYCTNLTDIYGIEKIDFSSVTPNGGLIYFMTNDSKLSNNTLLNLAKALLTVPTNYGNKALSHLGLNSTQANYIANNSTDWAELQTNGWITGY